MAEIAGASTEATVAPEIPKTGFETLIVLQRHSAYDSGRPKDPKAVTPDEESRLGRLTEDKVEDGKTIAGGKTLARQRAHERLSAIFSEDPQNTYVLVANSPTYWLDNPKFGRRAQETANIISTEIQTELARRGLPPDQFLNNTPNPNPAETKAGKARKTRFRGQEGSITKLETNLQESQMFQYPKYTAKLREKYQGQGPEFWKNRNLDTDRELREKLGAPGPADDARDINLTVSSEARYARLWHARPENKGKRLVIWNVTHGDGLEPYVQRVVGAAPEDFRAGYNDGIAIAIDSTGSAKTKIGEKEFNIPVAAHGKNLPPPK